MVVVCGQGNATCFEKRRVSWVRRSSYCRSDYGSRRRRGSGGGASHSDGAGGGRSGGDGVGAAPAPFHCFLLLKASGCLDAPI